MYSIVSNASNFIENIFSGVDPRTGDYSLSVNIGNFLSHKTSGSTLSLSLRYSIHNKFDIGFGQGWNIALSSFDKDRNYLYLSSGQSFEIKFNTDKGEYDIPYRKLKDLRVFYLNSTQEIKVVHKDGTLEFIDYQKGTLTRVVSNHGLDINFQYDFPQNYPVLKRIFDNTGRELLIDRNDKLKTKITHQFNGNTYQNIVFEKYGLGGIERLSRIIFLDDNQETSIEYNVAVGEHYDVIARVTHASGMIEEITYNNYGHQLPLGAPVGTCPYVVEYRMIPGDNQDFLTIQYSFSTKNYLGYGSDQSWVEGQDTLFKVQNDYKFVSAEIINGQQKIVRTYNKYHLLEKAEYIQNGTTYKLEENNYYAELDKGIDQQPAQYSLLKAQHITYYHNSDSRRQSTTYSYDEYTNPLSQIEPDGSRTVWQYYPAKGENDACPPEPNGMVSLLKSETHYPSNTTHSEQPRQTLQRYIKLSKLNRSSAYAEADYFVLLSEQQLPDKKVHFSYHNDVKKPLHYGRIKQELQEVNGYQRSTELSYEFGDTTLMTSSTLTTHDGLTLSASETIRYQDGQVIEKINAEGVVSRANYDELGRVIQDIFAPNTEYEAITRYKYSVNSGNNSITTIDPKGNKQTQHFNNAGKLIRLEMSDVQSALRIVKRCEYDSFGLLVTQHETDYLHDSVPLTLTTKFEYDMHGEVSKIVHPDGRVELIEQDLARLVTHYRIPELMSTHTRYNLSGQEVYKETLDADDYTLAKTKYVYDGFGNLLSTEDTQGRITRMSYDKSDRLLRIDKTIAGELVSQQMYYANFTTDTLVTKMQVNGIELGRREYDGLARLTHEQSSAAGTQRFSYPQHSLMPTQTTTALGNNITMVNNAYLQVMTQRAGQEETTGSHYTYDKLTGQLLEDANQYTQRACQYNCLGQLILESVQYIDGTKQKANYSYSLQGQLLSKTDFFGVETTYHYDEFGRIQHVVTGRSETVLSYDAFSRPIKFETGDGSNKVEIMLTLNALGLEGFRRVLLNDTEAFTLEQVFNQDLKIVEKIHQEQGQTTIETMTYDDLHRLVEYRCDGPNHPNDELGHSILAQHFSYDLFGNITEVNSELVDKEGNPGINRAQHIYDKNSPVRLLTITNTHPNYPPKLVFNYDTAGNLLLDDQGREYRYNELGQIAQVAKDGEIISEYYYNSIDEVVCQRNETALIHLYYQGDALVNELCNGMSSHYHSVAGAATSRTVHNQYEDIQTKQMLIHNAQGSVLASVTANAESTSDYATRQYTAYGQG
ncbi:MULTISPECIES: RHS repeat protein [unclassified Vibrio]|uniref:RHS repeat protein n=1 Tax=unclassified Vibrio TaxID=2614977 RepID=UPI002016530C|nr:MULTISPECIES: RHS repeat protein [unclassified Vibrio]